MAPTHSHLRLRLGGVELEAQLAEPLASWARTEWGAFLVEPGTLPVPSLRIDQGVLSAPPPGQRALPAVRAEGGGLRIEGLDWSAERRAAGTPLIARGRLDPSALALLVQLLLAELMAARGGLALHGVGLELSGRAALFVGPSGAGKSTLGLQAERGGARLLSDELVLVLPEGDGFRAYGTPWNRGGPVSAPLALLGLLAFGEVPQVAALPAGAVLRVLMPNALILDTGPAPRQALFEAASRVLQKIRTVRFTFPPTPALVPVLREALETVA